MNKLIAPFQFITIDHPVISHAEQAIRAYRAGCKWVQLRMKDVDVEEIKATIKKILPIAQEYSAVLIINDHARLVLETGAHGVHLGKNDMCASEARALLGKDKIIGGTANTLEDVISLIHNDVDYIGLGPFRFTTTKKKLSPVLGFDGYRQIMQQLKMSGCHAPVVAIGGITLSDVDALLQTEVSGLAIASDVLKDMAIERNIASYRCKLENSMSIYFT